MPATRSRAEGSVKHLAGFFEGSRVIDITTPRIREYIEGRQEEGAANATINRELAALKRMLNIGAEQAPPKVGRLPHIPMLQEDNVRKGFFEYPSFIALKDALPEFLKGFVTFGIGRDGDCPRLPGLLGPRLTSKTGSSDLKWAAPRTRMVEPSTWTMNS